MLALFFVPHLFDYAALTESHAKLPSTWLFWFNPFRAITHLRTTHSDWLAPAALAVAFLVDWLLVALSFRRARQAGVDGIVAASAMLPFVQIPAIVWLMIAPIKRDEATLLILEPSRSKAEATICGLLVGTAISVGAVALSATILRTYDLVCSWPRPS